MRRADEPHAADPSEALRPSKTRRKQAMHELQDLGAALVFLDERQLAALALPERLADAVRAARDITRHEARRRQMQYIGRLMREVDPAPLRAALEQQDAVPRAERAQFAAAERWRDRLLEDASAVAEFMQAFPAADRVAIFALVHDARDERARNIAPRHYRELFRAIRDTLCAARTAETSPRSSLLDPQS